MPPRKTAATSTSVTAQDKPFIYKSRTGAVITISSQIQIDPDMDGMAAMQDLRDEMDAAKEAKSDKLPLLQTKFVVVYYRFIKASFPPEVAATISLKTNELDDFLIKYQAHTGVNVPK